MINRFMGDNGKRRLVEALLQQPLIHGNKGIAEKLADKVDIIQLAEGDCLINQSGTDDDLYFVLTGRLSIQVNGREIAFRPAGKYVGEMSVIDPQASRSASVFASEKSVVAKITEEIFSQLAEEYPELWRHLACELGNRLRQRNDLVRERNQQPRIFIGSSTETLQIAREIQTGLAHDNFIVSMWTNDVFGASNFILESLENATTNADFAVLVVGSDDKVISRGANSDAPRDNVIFELGLFIGSLGRRRVFVVIPRDQDIKIPTDLLGLILITYTLGDKNDLAARLGSVCNEIRNAINALGSK